MSNWIQELRENIATEFDRKPAVITLATLRTDSTPDARSVVMRKLFDDGRLLITSDARSEKNKQLKYNPAATVVLWLPTQKKQFRIDGKIDVLTEPDPIRSQAWTDSSDSARALFYWPTSGQLRTGTDDLQFPKNITVDQPIPESFEVLLFQAQAVDILNLNSHPHLRRKFSWNSTGWNESIINP